MSPTGKRTELRTIKQKKPEPESPGLSSWLCARIKFSATKIASCRDVACSVCDLLRFCSPAYALRRRGRTVKVRAPVPECSTSAFHSAVDKYGNTLGHELIFHQLAKLLSWRFRFSTGKQIRPRSPRAPLASRSSEDSVGCRFPRFSIFET